MKYRYIMNGESLKINSEKCTGCGICVEVCPHAVLAVTEKKAVVTDKRTCMECGACARNCPVAAITVSSGVGCAQAIILGKLRGTAPECGGDSCCGDGKPKGGSCC